MWVEVLKVLALLLVALQLGAMAKVLSDLRAEISNARWEWNRRLGNAQSFQKGLQPLDGHRTDPVN